MRWSHHGISGKSPIEGAPWRVPAESPACDPGRAVGLGWAYRLVDVLIVVGTTFTILQNVNYLLGGSLFTEVVLLPPMVVLAFAWLRRFPARHGTLRRLPESHLPGWALVGCLGALALADPARLEDPWLRSLLPAGFALLAAAALLIRWRPSVNAPPAGATGFGWSTRERLIGRFLVPSVMILGAAVSLCVHRPDADDAAYVGWAAHLAAQPFEMLPREYPFIGTGVPLPYPPFPFMSYLDAIAAAAWLTGTEPMWIAGVVVAPLGGAAIVLAYAIAAHTLAGRRWPWVWLVAVAWLLIDGSANKALADFAFIRIWQGKCLLLHVLLPIVLSATLRFVSAPSFLSGLRVGGLGICAVAVSPIAIWIVPTAIGMGLVAGAIAERRRFELVGLAPVLALHPLVVGIISLVAVRAASHAPAVARAVQPPSPLRLPYLPFRDVLGTGENLKWMLGALAIGALFGGTRRLRAVAAVSTLTVMLCFANPAVGDFVARYVTKPAVYWRVMWLLPMPIVLGAMVEAITRVGWPRSRVAGAVLAAAFGVWLLVALPTVGALAEANKVRFAPPGPQAPPRAWAMADHLREILPRDSDVVAAGPVAWVLPTMLRTPRAYLPRQNMAGLVSRAPWGSRRIQSIRSYALAYASGRAPLRPGIIQAIASEPSVRAFVTVPRPHRVRRLTSLLRERGFVGPERRNGWLLFVRPSTASRPTNDHRFAEKP